MNKNEIAAWLRKKPDTKSVLVFLAAFDGIYADIFRSSSAGLAAVPGGAAELKSDALKKFSDAVCGAFAEDSGKSARLKSALKTPGGDLRRTYFSYLQSGKKINRSCEIAEGIEVSASLLDDAYAKNAEEIIREFVRQRLEFCEQHALRDEDGFGILITGECSGMAPVEYTIRKAFAISPFMPSAEFDMYGGVVPVLTDKNEIRKSLAGSHRLSVNSRGIYYIDEDGSLRAVNFGTWKLPAKGKMVSAGEHHAVIVNGDGTCTAVGSNDMGECNIEGVSDAVGAYASGDATYLVHKDGTVSAHGTTPLGKELATWKNIKTLAGGRGFVAGLKNDGTVVCAREKWLKDSFKEIDKWSGVTDIAAGAGCIAALKDNGTVTSSCMDPGDKRKNCILLKHVVGIAVDNRYIYGLKRSGEIIRAGGGSELTSMGRTEVGRWDNVLAIAAGNACVAALMEDGSVKAAGNITLPAGWDGTWTLGRPRVMSSRM